MEPGARFEAGCGFGMQALFDWYFGEESGGVGVGFAHDLRDGHIASGAYVNFSARPLDDMGGFFAALGRPEAAADAPALMGRLGAAWTPWYLGLFPHRAGAPCRLGAFVSRRRQGAYAADGPAFADDLARAGFAAVDEEMLRRLRELASPPYGLELQLDATADGTGETLAVDLVVPRASAGRVRTAFADGGPGAETCALLKGWGLADSRWRRIADAAISRSVTLAETGEPVGLVLTCIPAFIKVKWVDTRPQAAKVYFQCAARLVSAGAASCD